MDERECRRILEIADDASLEEIGQAYHLLKRLYENERAVFSAPSMDEFSPDSRNMILEEIETAYRELSHLLAAAQPQVHVVPVVLPKLDRPLDGRALRSLREAAGISLEYVASQTHVRLEHLTAMEEDRFWDLPPAAVNVRGFLSAYAMEIGLPVDDVVPPYMERFQKWQARKGR
jgi:hypothetical protein